MEDTILIDSNVAYHVSRNVVQHRQVNGNKHCSKEGVPTEVNGKAMDKAANQDISKSDSTNNYHNLSEPAVDDLKVALIKMKKLLVCVTLLCAALVITTLTAITLSALSYRLSQTHNEHLTRLNKINNTVSQNILHLDKHLQKKLKSLQIQSHCGAGQWHRIAYLNVTDPSQQCPQAWREYNTSGVRACGRTYSTVGSCSNVTYEMDSIVYSRVCGQVIGYQVGSPDAFNTLLNSHIKVGMDGVIITQLGKPHRHIWSLVSSLSEGSSLHIRSNCPCSFTSGSRRPPPFIGSNYYCESGNPTDIRDDNQIYSDDPLWDGQRCEGTCCTGANHPPWFSVQLPAPTTDMIEVSICADESTDSEDTPIKLLEIYIQ